MLFRKRNVNNKTKKVKKLETNVMTHLPKKRKKEKRKNSIHQNTYRRYIQESPQLLHKLLKKK